MHDNSPRGSGYCIPLKACFVLLTKSYAKKQVNYFLKPQIVKRKVLFIDTMFIASIYGLVRDMLA